MSEWRAWRSVTICGPDVDVMPWREPTLAWHFLAGRADRLGETSDVTDDIGDFTLTGEPGTVIGEHGIYTVERAD